jgi:uncharacterized protein (DUF486 family)
LNPEFRIALNKIKAFFCRQQIASITPKLCLPFYARNMMIIWTTLLLIGSNLFMTYAWYGHLRDFKDKPLWFVIILSWCVALFEYCLQVPANRLGFQQAGLSLQQLKVLQEIITMSVFATFAVVYMKERLSINFVYASLCMVAAAWFMFTDIKHPA